MMLCPKCGHENLPEQEDCVRCGVIFAKVKQSPLSQELAPEGHLLLEQTDGIGQASSYHSNQSPNSFAVWGRGLILLGMIVWSFQLIFTSIASNTAGESLLHLVNLPFHEAGHVFFRPFGQFMMTMGGTLGQLLVPFICGAVLLLKTRDPFGATVCGWWFGENFLDIAPYINDARAGVLPLVGGNTGHSAPYGFHDWEYLLTETGLLRHDQLLAKMAHGFGSVVMIAAMVFAGYLVWGQLKGGR
jgi:hypothetical protein